VVTGDVQDEPDGTVGALGTGPAATEDWAEGAWSNDEGFPSCVTFHEQRLAFAATTNSPQTVWASESQSFESFNDTSTDDSDAYSYKIASEQVNRIRWLSSGPESLQIGTAGSTFSLSSGSAGVPITPSSVLVRRETTYGAANILPKRIGPYVYFIQRNLKVLREIGYSLDLDSQQALDMTILSNHVTGRTGIVDMAYQQAPHDMLWCIRKDGQMATLTRQIDHKVIGWARQISGEDSRGAGLYESVACVPVEEADDETWVIVKRYINGSSVRYIEYFKPEDFDADHDMFFVDSGLSLDSPLTITAATAADPVVVTATSHGFSDGDQVKIIDVVGMTELNNNIYLVSSKTDHTFELTDLSGNDIDGSEYTAYISGGEVRKMVTTISGLDHLEGETVAVSADGAARANNTVASGAITLSSKASVVHVGLPYLPILQGLPLTDGSPTGTGAGKIRRIFQAVVRFYRTIGGEFGDEDSQDVIKFLDMSVPLGQPSPLFTGIKDDLPVDASWNRSGEFYITQPQPLPMTILFVVLMSQENE